MDTDGKRVLAFLLAVIAMNVVFAAFVRGPLSAELASVEGRIGRLKRLEAGLAAGSGERSGKGAPRNQKGMGAAFAAILGAAREGGLEIQEAEYNGAAGSNGRDAYAFSFPVEGSYGQIKKLIFSIETMGRRIEVDEISLAATGKALAARLGIHMQKGAAHDQ